MENKGTRFKTPYNSRPFAGEKHGGVSKTEKAGYLPPKKIIESMVMAGMRLKAFRSESFDLAEGEEDDGESIDPTRSPGFDMADASQIALELNSKAKRKKASVPEGSDTLEPRKVAPEGSVQEPSAP